MTICALSQSNPPPVLASVKRMNSPPGSISGRDMASAFAATSNCGAPPLTET
jgi:hypothetical protein